MISFVLVSTALLGLARSAVVPTAPGPGQVFKQGDQCTLSWNLDTTGKWTNFNVDLMSGSNFAMQTVTNVFKGRDGTKGDTTYSWTCPQVSPNSAIYFYQFSQDGADTTWTTRFAIASPSGQTTPPANSVQPGGAAIPWGVGNLAGAGATPAASNQTVTPTATNTTASNTSTTIPPNSTTTTGVNNTSMAGTASNTTKVPPTQSTTTSSYSSTGQSSTTGGKTSSSPNSSSTSGGNVTPDSSGVRSSIVSVCPMVALALMSIFIAL